MPCPLPILPISHIRFLIFQLCMTKGQKKHVIHMMIIMSEILLNTPKISDQNLLYQGKNLLWHRPCVVLLKISESTWKPIVMPYSIRTKFSLVVAKPNYENCACQDVVYVYVKRDNSIKNLVPILALPRWNSTYIIHTFGNKTVHAMTLVDIY